MLAKPTNIREISNEEMDRIFDSLAQYHFGLSGEEILLRWERGDHNDLATQEYWEANSLIALRPGDG